MRVELRVENGTSTITTLNHTANLLHLKGGGGKLDINTFNQTSENSDTQVFDITITDFNLSGGKTHQLVGEITNLNITNGTFYQGKHNGDPSGYSDSQITGGTITKVDLSGNGAFEQIRGSVTDFNQSGGTATQKGGTIGTANLNGGNFTQSGGEITTAKLSGGTFTHNGGTLNNVVLKAGGSGSTFVNGTNSAFANITQEGGNHTIIGKVAKFTLASGSFTNNGSIETLTTSTTTTRALRNAQAAATNHITNNGTIDKLELTKDADSVTNNAVYNTGGGLASGIIKELHVTSGNATINTLNGVGQGTAGKIEPHTLSNINITKDAKLTVDTLSVGLKGNQAIERVTINNNTGGNGGNKEFAVNKIQVTYLDGSFDPAKSISKNLTDYVSSGTSHSYVDNNSKPTFESSPELQGIGVKFNPDGTPIFEVEASLAASMTSVVVRQSMRRKMLIDTYLAEQNRRSLKNKERRTEQRIEAATLADARAQYQKDLAKYKLDLAKWDKLASTKENKALIAKYEQEDKAYQKALEQYQKDKAKWDKLSEKDKAKLSGSPTPAPIAPKEPKAPIKPNVKPDHKDYKKLMAAYDKAQKEHKNALAKYQKDKAKYDKDKAKWDKDNQKLAQASKLAPVEPKAPKAPVRPNLKPNHKDYKKAMADFTKAQQAHKAALAKYEKDLAKYKLDKAKWDKDNQKLAASSKPAPIAPKEPKAPIKPNVKPDHKDYKKLMAAYDKAQKEHKNALAKYQKDKAKYDKDKAKWDKDNQKLAQAGKAPVEPKAPTKPKILASKPEMPQEPKLGEISAELLAKHKVQGDFFIRAYGGTGSHKATNGAQTNSWSVGTLFGSTWDLALGQTSGNIGFYGGYEYIYNGYKQAHIDAQGHTGFLGLRFSHIFAKTKLAGFYYMADVNGGYSDMSVGQDMNGMRFSANVGNINFGSSLRLGSSVYMYGSKSILFPSVGVGVEGGYLGEFEMRTDRSGELRYGGLSQGYAVTYAQANLNYYQEYGKRISTTLGGGFRYLMNTDINIMPTLNGKAYTIDEKTGRAAAVHLAPFFYQGTFVINYHTDKAGNFSAGYVVVGGELGITHNASVRWHYFF
ncbi:hypothetical protein [uncultured Helicobacter sp.]|uniref:hypothetical protein n=1 Tax=uncultured Helicobacter sp. TaxID=175537 RepID=UPI002636E36C|nr:hypothetical protein [uncultured Helicobacter sp.]